MFTARFQGFVRPGIAREGRLMLMIANQANPVADVPAAPSSAATADPASHVSDNETTAPLRAPQAPPPAVYPPTHPITAQPYPTTAPPYPGAQPYPVLP